MKLRIYPDHVRLKVVLGPSGRPSFSVGLCGSFIQKWYSAVPLRFCKEGIPAHSLLMTNLKAVISSSMVGEALLWTFIPCCFCFELGCLGNMYKASQSFPLRVINLTGHRGMGLSFAQSWESAARIYWYFRANHAWLYEPSTLQVGLCRFFLIMFYSDGHVCRW